MQACPKQVQKKRKEKKRKEQVSRSYDKVIESPLSVLIGFDMINIHRNHAKSKTFY